MYLKRNISTEPVRQKQAHSLNTSYNAGHATGTRKDLSPISPTRQHKYQAGLLSAKTLAEENLRGFKLKNMQKESDVPIRVNQPQRIELPVYFNTPRRKEDIINRRTFGQNNSGTNTSFTKFNSGLNMSYTDSYNRIAAQKRLKDYSILAFACKRAGKSRDEGRAYYSTGVLCDNLGKFKSAVEFYQKFLQVCKTIGDVHGEALAYNCIGVDYQKLAETEPQYYERSIEFHQKHKEIADVAGKFLAHINLGIIYEQIGDGEKASINHQFALRYAIQMSSVAGQSLAIGNLGKIGTQSFTSNNPEKLQMFVERYLELSSELKNRKGDGGAYYQLGQLMTQKGDFDSGTRHFYRAMKIAEENGDPEVMDKAKVSFGMANANLKWNDHIKGILTHIKEYSTEEEDPSARDKKHCKA